VWGNILHQRGNTMGDVWFIILLVSLAVMSYCCHLCYIQGIWDGAFNQFLPRVQKHMLEYDPHRAEQILKQREK